LEVVAKAIYLLNFYSGWSMYPATVGNISVLRSRRKNVTAPVPELLVFMCVAPDPELSFFMAQTPAPASVRFHTLIF